MKVRVQNHALYMVVFAMAAVALDTPIASERDAATPLQRRGMIPPRRSNTRSTRLMTAARFRPEFNCRELVLSLHGSDDQNYFSSSDDQGEKMDCHTRNSSIRTNRYINNSRDMLIV